MNIVVVDDEPEILEEIIELLSDEGYQVRSASCANDALKLLAIDSEVDLIITDIKMPGKSGVDFITEASQKYGDKFHVIFISGHGFASTEKELDAIGSHELLTKPLDIYSLLDTTQRLEITSAIELKN